MTALVLLCGLGLVVAGAATTAAFRTSLLRNVDDQLAVVADSAYDELLHGMDPDDGVMTAYADGAVARLLDADGSAAASMVASAGAVPGTPPVLGGAATDPGPSGERRSTVTGTGEDGDRRVLARSVAGGQTLVVAVPLAGVERTVRQLVVIEAVVAAVVIVVLAALARWATAVGLRPLDRIGATAEAIAAGDLSRRVDEDDGTEVGRLGASLNVMLGRIEAAFAARAASEQRLRRFVADAGHELRTPLTTVRAHAELFRRGAADRPDDLADAMRRIEDESARMGQLVDDLLLLARLDADRPLERVPVDLGSIAADAVIDARAAQPGRRIDLDADSPVVVVGDGARLRQVVANLLANARVHTPPGTPVRVAVGAENGAAVLEVVDRGPGLEPEAAARVFDRFYRGDSSRSRGSGGSGLGLSIVADIVRAHRGRVDVRSAPGQGATFRVELPRERDRTAQGTHS